MAEDESKKSSQKYIKAKKVRGNVDREFIKRVVKLFKQLVPSWRNKEVGYIVGLGFLVILRTMMSIWLADVNGRVVKAIVNKDIKMFAKRVSFPLILKPCLDLHLVFVCNSKLHSEFSTRVRLETTGSLI